MKHKQVDNLSLTHTHAHTLTSHQTTGCKLLVCPSVRQQAAKSHDLTAATPPALSPIQPSCSNTASVSTRSTSQSMNQSASKSMGQCLSESVSPLVPLNSSLRFRIACRKSMMFHQQQENEEEPPSLTLEPPHLSPSFSLKLSLPLC